MSAVPAGPLHVTTIATDPASSLPLPQKDVLYCLSDRLQQATSHEQVYAAALDAILSALPRDRASILLLDEQHVMRFVAWRGLSDGYRAAVEGHSPWTADDPHPAPVCIEDVNEADLSAELKATIAAEGIGAAGFFPLIGGRGLIGKFMTYADAARPYTIEEIELSLTIARQLTVAIERLSAVAALRASELRLRAELSDTRLLQRMSAELVSEDDVQSLYEKLVEAATTIMRSDFASMQAIEADEDGTSYLLLLAYRGLSDDSADFWKRVTIDSGSVCGEALRTRERVQVTDVEKDERTRDPENLHYYRQSGIRSCQTTPLFARSGNLVGMISTQWRTPHAPSERDLRLFDILTRQAADLIERRRANDELAAIRVELAQEVNDLTRLHELSARLMQHTSIRDVLEDLLLATTELVQAERGSIQIYDRRTDSLKLISTVGLPDDFCGTFELVDAAGFTTCAAALRQGRRVVVTDLTLDPAFTRLAEAAAPYSVRGVQSTPIMDESGTVAAMLTTYCGRPHCFSERELRLLDLYAEVTVRQIERQRTEETLAFLADLSAAFAPLASMSDIAHITGERVRQHFGAARATFGHIDETGTELSIFHAAGDASGSEVRPHALHDYLSETALRELAAGQPVSVSDVEKDSRTAKHASAFHAWNVRSMVLAPHVSQGQARFVLSIDKERPCTWRAKDVELLMEVATRVHMRLERARAEEALATSEAMLRENDRRKDEFLAMLAHELRNPLAPIVNAVHLLARSASQDPLQQHVRAVIDRQTTRLTRLVDDLLEVSRITSGRIQLHRENICLAGIIERAVETVRPLIEQHHHALRCSAPREPLWLYADATRLEQVLVNLLNNAAKYTENGGSLQLLVHKDGEHVVIRVVDNGIGIERAFLPRIFELFTQAERSLDRSGGGLGIGLSLVRKLVTMHGGSVSVDSTVGAGSTFTVRLPLARAPGASSEPDSQLTHGSSAHPLKVMVVDDNVDAAQTFAMLLRLSGHEVRTAHDGAAALKLFEEVRPQVVFLDIGLPMIDGYEAAQRIRELDYGADVSLVAVTGYGQTTDRARALVAGFDHHLVKPVAFSSLDPIMALAAARALKAHGLLASPPGPTSSGQPYVPAR